MASFRRISTESLGTNAWHPYGGCKWTRGWLRNTSRCRCADWFRGVVHVELALGYETNLEKEAGSAVTTKTLKEIVAEKCKPTEVIGIDLAQESVAYSKKKRPDFQLAVAHAEQLPFGEATFDMVFCSEVLEHVDRPEKMLAEIRRCLKRDGYAIVEVPTETWFFKAI